MRLPGPSYVTIGYDGSPNSTFALPWAAGEARRRRVSLDGRPCRPPPDEEGRS
jgi:hypothetical protein